MKFKKTMIGLATVAGLVFVAGAHAQDVVIYSGNNTAVIEKAAAILKEKLPNLDVAFVRGKTGALLKRMEAEAKVRSAMSSGPGGLLPSVPTSNFLPLTTLLKQRGCRPTLLGLTISGPPETCM